MLLINKLNLNFEVSSNLEFFWLFYANIISLIIINLLVIFFGMTFPNEAKSIKIINLISAYLIGIFFLLTSWEYIYECTSVIYLQIICEYNYSIFVNYFFFFSTLIIIFYYISISKTLFLEENSKMEYSLLIFYIYMAAVMLITSLDLISIIILLECIAFSSYVLIGYERKNKLSATAALKYLILASIPGGFFILGTVILYANYGTFFENYLYILISSLDKISAPDWTFFLENFKEYPLLQTEIQQINNQKNFISQVLIASSIDLENFFIDSFFGVNFIWEFFYKIFLMENILFLIAENSNEFFSSKTMLYFVKITSKYDEAQIAIFYLLLEKIYIYWSQMFILLIQEILIFLFRLESFFLLETNTFNLENFEQFFILFCNTFSLNQLLNLSLYLQIPLNFTNIFSAENPFTDECKNLIETIYITNFHNLDISLNVEVTSSDHFFILYTWWNLIDQAFYVTEIYDSFLYWYDVQINYWYNIKNILEYQFVYGLNFFNNNIASNKDIVSILNNIWQFYENEIYLENFFIKIKVAQQNPLNLYSFLENYSYDNIIKIIMIAIIFIIINISFKITAAPFHVWAPRIYGNSSLPVVTFLSIFSKLTLIFFSLWLFFYIFDSIKIVWQPLILFLGILSIFFSLLGTFSEKLIRRFFVYSSMSHVGFMLLGFGVLNVDGIVASLNYLIVYCISSFIIWYTLMHLTKQISHVIGLKGLSFNNPVLSWILTLTLFSFSGLPPMGGFFVKFEVLYSIINSSYFFLGFIVLVCTVVSFYYYLRVIKIIYFEDNLNSKKNKNLDDFQLRIISFGIIILPFFAFFIQESIVYFIYTIITTSFR